MCGKKDWGIRTGESDIKIKRITILKIAKEQVFIETVIKQWEMMVWSWKWEFKTGNHRCFLPADSFQNVIKF